MKASLVGFAALVCAVVNVEMAAAADADNGRRLAERWCSACHVIKAD